MTCIPVDMACNDPDNGLFAGRIEQLQISSEFLELEAWGRPIRLVELPDGRLRIAGRIFHCKGSKEWFGNWCWNRYLLPLGAAQDLLVFLHRRRFFRCGQAEERLFNLWRKAELEAADIAVVRRLLEKEALHA